MDLYETLTRVVELLRGLHSEVADYGHPLTAGKIEDAFLLTVAAQSLARMDRQP